MVSSIYVLKEVCYLTIAAINFSYGADIFSEEHLKRSICKGHYVHFTTLNKRSVVEELKDVFEESHYSPTLLKELIYCKELVVVVFV